jgi:flagellar export protein FliJ
MDKSVQEKSDLDLARRQESKAFNELEYRTQQAKEQKVQLDTLLEYRDECMEGLTNARETGLTPVHVREYQLLMKHINSVVEVIEHKVNASQDNLDKAQEVWHKKNEHFVKIKESINKNSATDAEERTEETEDSTEDKASVTKKYYGHKY